MLAETGGLGVGVGSGVGVSSFFLHDTVTSTIIASVPDSTRIARMFLFSIKTARSFSFPSFSLVIKMVDFVKLPFVKIYLVKSGPANVIWLFPIQCDRKP